MPSHGSHNLNFFPAYCFHLSPTYNTWAHLTASDIHALGERPGFEGQNLYFHLNHPIRWIRLIGVVVAFDVLPSRFIFAVDDSSGATIEVTCERPKKPALPIETTGESSRTLALPELPTTGVTARGGEISLAGLDVGTVVKVKGGIGAYRGVRQILLERLSVIRSTNEEAAAWAETSAFRNDVLDKVWVLDEREEKRARRKAEGRDKGKKIRKTKMKGKTEDSHNESSRPRIDRNENDERLRLAKENVREKARLERQQEMERQQSRQRGREQRMAKEKQKQRQQSERQDEMEKPKFEKAKKERTERENLREKAKLERQQEMEKQQQQQQQLEQREKKIRNERYKIHAEAAKELEEAELDYKGNQIDLQKQRQGDEQQRHTTQAERAKEQVKKKRDADRAERERIFAEQQGALKSEGIKKPSRKERRTDNF